MKPLDRLLKVPRTKVRNPFVVAVFKRKAGKHAMSKRRQDKIEKALA
jgi:hypothetical protein